MQVMYEFVFISSLVHRHSRVACRVKSVCSLMYRHRTSFNPVCVCLYVKYMNIIVMLYNTLVICLSHKCIKPTFFIPYSCPLKPHPHKTTALARPNSVVLFKIETPHTAFLRLESPTCIYFLHDSISAILCKH